jgi:hypothetical protein
MEKRNYLAFKSLKKKNNKVDSDNWKYYYIFKHLAKAKQTNQDTYHLTTLTVNVKNEIDIYATDGHVLSVVKADRNFPNGFYKIIKNTQSKIELLSTEIADYPESNFNSQAHIGFESVLPNKTKMKHFHLTGCEYNINRTISIIFAELYRHNIFIDWNLLERAFSKYVYEFDVYYSEPKQPVLIEYEIYGISCFSIVMPYLIENRNLPKGDE